MDLFLLTDKKLYLNAVLANKLYLIVSKFKFAIKCLINYMRLTNVCPEAAIIWVFVEV